MVILARLAFEDYSRSAASACQCHECQGKGLIYSRKEVVKHPGLPALLWAGLQQSALVSGLYSNQGLFA
ncbi:hypothetical protein [Xenorhabdus sp. NBAII XenSa04]|nr:hypothetical protein [Xenorhabdus sp. NBAII XenSa04]